MSHSTRGWISGQVHSLRRRLSGEGFPGRDLLSEQRVRRVAEEEGVWWRECFYSPMVTLWTFLWQVLSRDHSCRDAVARLLACRVAQGETPCSAKTGPYCKARQRLPERLIARLAREVGQELHRDCPGTHLLGGRPVKLIDGSTVSMPDTPENQAAYPQPRSQKPGLGFPVARVVAVISLSCGAVLDFALGPYRGKETGETALFRSLWDQFRSGDVAVADRCYGSFWNLALLLVRGVDGVFPLHQKRTCDFRRGQRLGREDHVVEWIKPPRPGWLDEDTYRQLPDVLGVRELRIRVSIPGFRLKELVLVTTLLDAALVTKEELGEVYRTRWHAELDLRAIKCTMHMEVLRCKTPEMVRKEIWMHLLAYNLIRELMAQAARKHRVPPRELSLTGALQTLGAFRAVLPMTPPRNLPALYQTLLDAVAAHRVGDRPNRYEPRALKRRVQKQPLLTKPRDQARARLAAKS